MPSGTDGLFSVITESLLRKFPFTIYLSNTIPSSISMVMAVNFERASTPCFGQRGSNPVLPSPAPGRGWRAPQPLQQQQI